MQNLKNFVPLGELALCLGLLVLITGTFGPVCASQKREPADTSYTAAVGPVPFTVEEIVWQDGSRGRTINTLVYSPKDMLGPLPLVLFSPGLGGSYKGYSYLGRAWASHGYVVVTFNHPGSGPDVVGPAALTEAIKQRKNVVLRVGDVRFVLDKILAGGHGHPVLEGRIDAKRIAMTGHSYGAYTTMTAAGLVFSYEGNAAFSMPDGRFKAAIAMGTQGIEDRLFGTHKHSWDTISLPLMTMTGTLDGGSRGQDYTWRNEAYEHLKPGDKYNVIIERATHLTYTGQNTENPLIPRKEPKHDPRHYAWIEMMTLAFLDAYIKDNDAAKIWLRSARPDHHTGGEMDVQWK
ncbi:MAG: hypothetical protein L0Y32_01820 [Nevskiales bacterium]|nr:hypothetical protein [Nevskiales bacterium]